MDAWMMMMGSSRMAVAAAHLGCSPHAEAPELTPIVTEAPVLPLPSLHEILTTNEATVRKEREGPRRQVKKRGEQKSSVLWD